MNLLKHFANKWAILALAVLVLAVGFAEGARVGVVHADDGTGYPWSGATYVDANYDWGYSLCPADDTGCMAFYGFIGTVKYGEADPWRYYLRNCTSYVAWKVNSVFSKVVS